MRARCGGDRFCPAPLGSLRLCGSGEKGRETRPLRWCTIMRRCIGRIRRGGVSPPVRGAYLAKGTLPSGEGGDDSHGTLHAFGAGHAGRGGTQAAPYGPHSGLGMTKFDRCYEPSGEGGNDTHSTLHELEARPAGGTMVRHWAFGIWHWVVYFGKYDTT